MFPLSRLAPFGLMLATLAASLSGAGRLEAMPSKAERAQVCRQAISDDRAAYPVLIEVALRSSQLDEPAARLDLSVEGVTAPQPVDFADPVQFDDVGSYADYLRERIGADQFDVWTGMNASAGSGERAARLIGAQRRLLEGLAAQAMRGEAIVALRSERSIWSPQSPNQASQFQLIVYQPVDGGCMQRPLGAPLARNVISPTLLDRAPAAAGV